MHADFIPDVFSPAVGARSSTKGNLFGQNSQVDDDDDEEYETEDDDAPDAVEDSHRLKTTKLADEVVRVGPFHPSVPQAMNKMWKERNKAHSGKDPNGRSKGRSLIMWHRKISRSLSLHTPSLSIPFHSYFLSSMLWKFHVRKARCSDTSFPTVLFF